MISKVVKVTNKGMISIPAEIRKKHGIKDGDHVIVEEDENGIISIQIINDVETLRKSSLPFEQFKEIFIQSRKEDMELER